ncbi:hypothetical protein N8310_08570 [Pseudomonadota bacterium]|nr:hypothetical protein [Pseudomonadota bacterium]
MKEKSLGYLASLLLLFPLIFTVIDYSKINSLNTWGASEWLISYSGGFVRRGLGGELILIISNFFSISPSISIVIISVFSYLILVITLIKISNKIIPTYILLSPILLGMPIYSNFLIRKDVLGILFLVIALILLKRNINIINQIFVNIVSILAILNHEAFLFFGLPIIMLTFNLLKQKKKWDPFVLIRFLPTLLVSVLIIIFHGTIEISTEIIQTWNSLINKNFSYCCILKEAPGINAIGDTITGPMSLSRSVLFHWSGGFLYVPLMWILSWCAAILILGQLAIKNQSLRSIFYILVLVQTILVFPLFIIGWDFGRWLFFILVSSISWISIFQDTLIKDYKIPILNLKKINFIFNKNIKIGIFILFFSIPQCCWTWGGYLHRTPFFSNYAPFSYIITGYSIKEQYQIISKYMSKNF